jgi:hypothetical protein
LRPESSPKTSKVEALDEKSGRFRRLGFGQAESEAEFRINLRRKKKNLNMKIRIDSVTLVRYKAGILHICT